MKAIFKRKMVNVQNDEVIEAKMINVHYSSAEQLAKVHSKLEEHGKVFGIIAYRADLIEYGIGE